MAWEFATGTTNFTANLDVNMRNVVPASSNIYNWFPDAQNNPRGITAVDSVIWKCTVQITSSLDNVWLSNDIPPRYRLGAYRLFYRGSSVGSGFLTQVKTELGQFEYSADVDYLAPQVVPGTFPNPPASEVVGIQIGNPELVCDRIVVNLATAQMTGLLTVHSVNRKANYNYFF